MPGSFNDPLKIDNNGHLSPKGPLAINQGETHKGLYIWVMQPQAQGEGAFIQCQGEPNNAANAWVMKNGYQYHHGKFKPGQAIAMGILTTEKTAGGKSIVFWWSVNIQVK